MNAPCYECQERHEACHDECIRYKEWHDEVQKASDRKKREHIIRYEKGWQDCNGRYWRK